MEKKYYNTPNSFPTGPRFTEHPPKNSSLAKPSHPQPGLPIASALLRTADAAAEMGKESESLFKLVFCVTRWRILWWNRYP